MSSSSLSFFLLLLCRFFFFLFLSFLCFLSLRFLCFLSLLLFFLFFSGLLPSSSLFLFLLSSFLMIFWIPLQPIYSLTSFIGSMSSISLSFFLLLLSSAGVLSSPPLSPTVCHHDFSPVISCES